MGSYPYELRLLLAQLISIGNIGLGFVVSADFQNLTSIYPSAFLTKSSSMDEVAKQPRAIFSQLIIQLLGSNLRSSLSWNFLGTEVQHRFTLEPR